MLELFKSLNSIEDIEEFIQLTAADPEKQSRENSNIEYKKAHQKFSNTNEIGKDVSAFANSEGGLIFYGVECNDNDRTKPTAITGLDPINIETFDRVVNSAIHYPIKGILKKLIPDHNPKVMLVYVPQSDESPHQNGDNKYYIRLGSESKPMPHYLVELHFGKRQKPELVIALEKIRRPDLSFKNDFSQPISFYVKIRNSGKGIAKYTQVNFFLPLGDSLKDIDSISGEVKPVTHLYKGKKVWQWQDHWVIHPTTAKSIWQFRARLSNKYTYLLECEEQFPILEWEIYSEGMKPQFGKVIYSSLFE